MIDRSKSGYHTVGLVTGFLSNLILKCVITFDHIASLCGRWSKTSAYTGHFGQAEISVTYCQLPIIAKESERL